MQRSALLAGLAISATVYATDSSANSFAHCVSALRSNATASGVSQAVFDTALRGVRPDLEVLEKASRQPEFTKPIWEYLDGAVSDRRVADGRTMKRRYRRQLAAIEATYGIDRHILLAIWGLESAYGAVLDNPDIVKPTIRSLATLACQGGRRAKFGRTQLTAALQIIERGDIAASQMTGSWAGAMGHTQFIPTTYNAYAVDFTGDGRRDIWHSVGDALASTANYLSKSGWQTGAPWGYEVRLPADFDFALADGAKARPIAAWRSAGIMRADGSILVSATGDATLVLPAGASGPAFLLFKNHRVIRRYNNAFAYALAIGHLADRIRGDDPLTTPWPRAETPLDVAERRELQAILNRRGFSAGGIDGKVGPRTRSAVRAFQRSAGLVADGYPSRSLLERLRAGG